MQPKVQNIAKFLAAYANSYTTQKPQSENKLYLQSFLITVRGDGGYKVSRILPYSEESPHLQLPKPAHQVFYTQIKFIGIKQHL